MGGYDTRDPSWVTGNIIHQLNARWAIDPPKKPLVLVTQGDPYEATGIAAITRLVADRLAIPRGMIFLDPDIADYHAPNADRYKVIFELPYSSLTNVLRMERPEVLAQIIDSVEAHLQLKNSETPTRRQESITRLLPRLCIVARSHQDRMQAYLWRDHGSPYQRQSK